MSTIVNENGLILRREGREDLRLTYNAFDKCTLIHKKNNVEYIICDTSTWCCIRDELMIIYDDDMFGKVFKGGIRHWIVHDEDLYIVYSDLDYGTFIYWNGNMVDFLDSEYVNKLYIHNSNVHIEYSNTLKTKVIPKYYMDRCQELEELYELLEFNRGSCEKAKYWDLMSRI